LATGGRGGHLRLWDVATWTPRADFDGHSGSVNVLAYSRDGRKLAVAANGAFVDVRDGTTGQLEGSFKVKAADGRLFGNFQGLAFSPDGRTLAVGVAVPGNPPLVEVYLRDVATLKEVGHFSVKGGNVKTLTYLADDALALAVGDTVTVWDPVTGKQRHAFSGHRKEVIALAVAPDGKSLASGSADKTIRLWDPATRETVAILEGHETQVLSLAYSRDGKTLASGGPGQRLWLWEVPSGRVLAVHQPRRGQPRPVSAVSFSPDGKLLAIPVLLGPVEVWDAVKVRAFPPAPPGDVVSPPRTADEIALAHPSDNPGALVTRLLFTPDDKTLVVGGQDGVVHLLDVPGFKLRARLPAHLGAISALAVSRDGKWLAVADGTAVVSLRQLPTGKLKELVPLEHSRFKQATMVRGLAFAPDGKTLAVGLGNTQAEVCLWDVAGRKVSARGKAHDGALSGLAWSPDGKTLATSADSEVKFWDVDPFKERLPLLGHKTVTQKGVTFSPDGDTVASVGGVDVWVWKAATGKLVRHLSGHKAAVQTAAYSPDGKLLATASLDNTVRVWDMKTYQSREITGLSPQNRVRDTIAFGGKLLAVPDELRNIRIWDVAKVLAKPASP
jgi:WD40 repeat protein